MCELLLCYLIYQIICYFSFFILWRQLVFSGGNNIVWGALLSHILGTNLSKSE